MLLFIFLAEEKRHGEGIGPAAASRWQRAPSKTHPVCTAADVEVGVVRSWVGSREAGLCGEGRETGWTSGACLKWMSHEPERTYLYRRNNGLSLRRADDLGVGDLQDATEQRMCGSNFLHRDGGGRAAAPRMIYSTPETR